MALVGVAGQHPRVQGQAGQEDEGLRDLIAMQQFILFS
jgi:hypothetical protein